MLFLNETKTSKNKKSKFGAGIFILVDFLPNFITFTSFGIWVHLFGSCFLICN